MSDLKAMIIQMGLNTDKSARAIGAELGCSGAYALEILNKEGIDRGRRIDWASYHDRIVQMLDDGASYVSIAEEVGCNPVSLRYYLVKNNLLRRKRFMAVEPKVEITEVIDKGKVLLDITDLMIERPCIVPTDIPEWKKENQERFFETQGKYGVFYGYY